MQIFIPCSVQNSGRYNCSFLLFDEWDELCCSMRAGGVLSMVLRDVNAASLLVCHSHA